MAGTPAVRRDCAPSLALLVLAWTNPWHHLYWTRIANEQIGRFWIAMPEYGAGFQVHFVYSYALVARHDGPTGEGRVSVERGFSASRRRSCSSGCSCRGR